MQVAKKKPLVKKRVKPIVTEKERKSLVRDIMGNIEKWDVNKKISVIEAGISKAEF